MTKHDLIAELERLSKEWHDKWNPAAANEEHWIGCGYDQAAEDLDSLIHKARQHTETTP